MFGKRGNLFDPLVIILVLFGFAISAVIFLVISSELRDGIHANIDTPESQAAITETVEAIKTFDYIFVILTSMMIVSALISAYFIKSHPIFFIISTILLFVFMIPAVVLSNAFEKYVTASRVAPYMADMPLVEYFMDKLPYVLLVAMLLILVVLFMYKGEGGGGGHYQ